MSERHQYAKVLVRIPRKLLDDFDAVCVPGHRSRNDAIVWALSQIVGALRDNTSHLVALKYLSKFKMGNK